MLALNPAVIRQQIENLKLSHPGLIEDDEAWQMSLESETEVHDLLTNIVRQIEDAKALVIGTQDRFEQLTARKKRFENRVEALRELAFKIMSAAELAKVVLPEATLSLRAGQQELSGDADPGFMSNDLCKITRTLNRTAIKDALKSGREIPGFTLTNGQPSITIRIK